MVRTKLPPHINGFIDRYGRARYYVRRPGHKNVRLPGLPWSPEFMAAYAEAVEGQQQIKIGEKRSPAGSVAATVGLYLGSTAFANLAADTQRTRRNILERFREEHGCRDREKACAGHGHREGENAVCGAQFPHHLAGTDRVRNRRWCPR
jgi:hypothetical protein